MQEPRTRPAGASALLGRAFAPPLLVAALAACLGLLELGRRSYWIDEAFNVVFVREAWPTFVRTVVDREPSQALYVVFLKPYIAAFGHDEVVTRLPSVAAAALAAALLVELGRRLFGRRAGVAAGVLLATNASVVEWSQYARTYSLSVLATVVTSLLFLRACRRGDRTAFVEYGVAGALSIYCHFYAGFVIVAHALSFFVARPRLPVRRLIEAWVVVAAGLVPFALYVVFGTRSPVEWIPPLGAHEAWAAVWFASGHNAALLAAAVAGAALLVAASRRRGWLEPVLAAGWVVVPLACGAAVSLVKPALVPRFLIVASPALALLAGVALDRIPRPAARFAAAVVVLAFSVSPLVHVYTQNPEDWRAAAKVARSAAARGSTIAVIPDFGWRALTVYAPDVSWVTTPAGNEVTVLVTAPAAKRPALVAAFIGRAPYHYVSTRRVGPGFVAERWVRDGSTP